MSDKNITPDYLFEVSWEVCNKIGGIHTVLSSKANLIREKMEDRYILIGPDVYRDSAQHPEFMEDHNLFQDWLSAAENEGLIVRAGRWKTEGNPLVLLVDFTTFFNRKDEIFKKFWELYHLDSITGQWDYIEPMLFGYATGKIIESFITFHGIRNQNVVAHFHEWMTGAALLYLREYQPQVATVFTTHATVVGRALAGNHQPLYSKLNTYNVDEQARQFGVVAKQSAEKIAANQADAYTTVSEITKSECERFLTRPVDLLTPNGFSDNQISFSNERDKARESAREKLLSVASVFAGRKLPADTFLLTTGGRYEFRNKGFDVFLDALKNLKEKVDGSRPIVAFIMVPAHHFGPRKDVADGKISASEPGDSDRYLTHHLHFPENDPILQRIRENEIQNNSEDNIHLVYVPSYLNGHDGIFNMEYYHLLAGFDLSIYPSYYDPWGYTPMESLAISVPTLTSNLTGFGNWVLSLENDPGLGISLQVVDRSDDNDQQVIQEISNYVINHLEFDANEQAKAREMAFKISRKFLWDQVIDKYWETYSLSLYRTAKPEEDYETSERVEHLPLASKLLTDITPVWRRMVVQQQVPAGLKFLEELSRNIWWSWNNDSVNLFKSIDPKLWEEVEENPILLLEKISYDRLKSLEKDGDFLASLEHVKNAYENYMHTPPRQGEPSVSYFSMEFGLHNSLKIYSGGLGLLAGDYLKEASDYNYNMVGIGLLYRFGYFRQVITSAGDQVAHEDFQDFNRIPVVPVKDDEGKWLTVEVVLPGRPMTARIWKAQVGRIPLYLLDADIEENRPMDRQVTHKLYGGDHENRFKQELLLGIGGVRALRKLGIQTDLYHLNEGHAAFAGIERLREFIQEYNMTFPEAREIVRATSLFTTHTPVPAGHDSFDENMMRVYLSHYPSRLTIDWNRLMNLGRENHDDPHENFSMSVLAVNLSQEVNGVSELHGQVSREMFQGMWKGHMADELHIGYVTNGVHLSTWLADSWRRLYLDKFGNDFLERQEDRNLWARIHDVPDEEIWNIRKMERKSLIEYIRQRLSDASASFMEDPRMAIEISDSLDENALTIGFARRFATYKRAHLLFKDLDKLASLVNNPGRPIQFVFAGKAHPKDAPGQQLIKKIVEISRMPEFKGKIIFLQNYNILLAKRLLHGVDIWLNTPTRPLEASGTSGEKAVMNGGLHFSVLDGWWAEGYREDAGWALPIERTFENQEQQDQLDAERIYSLLEHDIAPKFYSRNANDIPDQWVKIIKNSISGVAPEFTMNRMLRDYIDRFYSKQYKRSAKMKKDNYRLTREISFFKKMMLEQWSEIKVREMKLPYTLEGEIKVGDEYSGSVILDINGIAPENIGVEMVLAEVSRIDGKQQIVETQELKYVRHKDSVAEYEFSKQSGVSGQFDVGFRIFPKHDELPHRMDLPLIRWI